MAFHGFVMAANTLWKWLRSVGREVLVLIEERLQAQTDVRRPHGNATIRQIRFRN